MRAHRWPERTLRQLHGPRRPPRRGTARPKAGVRAGSDGHRLQSLPTTRALLPRARARGPPDLSGGNRTREMRRRVPQLTIVRYPSPLAYRCGPTRLVPRGAVQGSTSLKGLQLSETATGVPRTGSGRTPDEDLVLS